MPVSIIDYSENEDKRGGRDKDGNDRRTVEYMRATNQRAREKLKRLINANFNENTSFVTLTFNYHETDIQKANYELKKFLQKMKRRKKDFKHVTVLEFQKSGRIHYHQLNNMSYSWNNINELHELENELAAIWGNGFCDIGYQQNGNKSDRTVKGGDNLGAYLLKYLTKQNIDERLNGQKRYFWSRNLIQPEKVTGQEAAEIVEQMKNEVPVFTNKYEIRPLGTDPLYVNEVNYREYNPKR